MAFIAILAILVLGWKIFPVLLIAEAMESECISSLLRPEIARHIYHSEQQNQGDNPDDYIKRPPNMLFHYVLLLYGYLFCKTEFVIIPILLCCVNIILVPAILPINTVKFATYSTTTRPQKNRQIS